MSGEEYVNGKYAVSADPSRLDVEAIHDFLAHHSYWAEEIPLEVVARSIRHSLNFGVYEESGRQVGFARVISDFATYAYIADVYILEGHRGQGLSKFLMKCIMEHPALQGLRRWSLLTRDAHGLYRQFGFRDVWHPERYMELTVPGIYRRKHRPKDEDSGSGGR